MGAFEGIYDGYKCAVIYCSCEGIPQDLPDSVVEIFKFGWESLKQLEGELPEVLRQFNISVLGIKFWGYQRPGVALFGLYTGFTSTAVPQIDPEDVFQVSDYMDSRMSALVTVSEVVGWVDKPRYHVSTFVIPC